MVMVPTGASVLSNDERELVPAAFLPFRFTFLTMYVYEEVLGRKLEEWSLADEEGLFDVMTAVDTLRAGLSTLGDDLLVPTFDAVSKELTLLNYRAIAKMLMETMRASAPEMSEAEQAEAREHGDGKMDWLGLWAYCRQDLNMSEQEFWNLTLRLHRALMERSVERQRQSERQLAAIAAFFANGHFGSKSRKFNAEQFMSIKELPRAETRPFKALPMDDQFEHIRRINKAMGGREIPNG